MGTLSYNLTPFSSLGSPELGTRKKVKRSCFGALAAAGVRISERSPSG